MSENDEQPELDVRAAEANGDEIVVEWKGEKFTLPRDYGKWPLEYTLNMQKGLPVAAFEALFGDQFARVLAKRPTNADFGSLDEAVAKAMRMEPGESKASSV